MIQSDEILTNFSASSASFENLYSSHDDKCDYAKRPFRTFDANAKEKDYETGFHYYGSRYYSSELSIWNSTDPMADKYPSLTPYNYCANNPVKLIDPNGEEIEPVYTSKGEFRGTTKEGFTGQIYIYDGDVDFSQMTADDFGIVEGQEILQYSYEKMSHDAISKVWTDVVSKMEGEDIFGERFSLSKLKGIFCNPDKVTQKNANWTSNAITKEINGGITSDSYVHTVENLQMSIVVHEWYSHIIQKLSDRTNDHRKAYENVLNYIQQNNVNVTKDYIEFNEKGLNYYK